MKRNKMVTGAKDRVRIEKANGDVWVFNDPKHPGKLLVIRPDGSEEERDLPRPPVRQG